MCSVPSRVVELIETFGRDVEAYHSQQYNETQLRREFIDPFFEELGWDVTNKAGYAQAYKDVIHEDAIKVGGATKAPDYCFRIGGVRKFFLEAKKPSVNIKGDPHPAYQLRRYAWSAKLPLSILTDFEEFAVYDCQTRPKQTDKADTARIMYFTYKHYPDKWAKIADVFSRDAILKGSFDKFAVATKGKRGTTTVDTEFLKEIETWRRMLARIIALRNRSLSRDEINFAVQRTIDRIIFLRMCEDRGIEDYGQLLKISSGDRTYPRLCEIFEKADQRYNSGLFHFHDESDRPEAPDKLTPNLVIDDEKLKWILHSLYYPQSPYEFSVLPPEILGNVYEQFLGSVITISGAHRADVVPKPEVKKAGGVYYTPSYIVNYIVKNTVGKLLGDHSCHCEEDTDGGRRGNLKSLAPTPAVGVPEHPKRKPLTPRQVANLSILDPACGSGSFLLGAYTYLLNYHRDWYVDNDPQKYTKKIYQGKGGQWYLTNAEKKNILLNNIFGVDIDSQAVEVTKLSLLLKVLEGEDAQTLENQYRLFHERALPDLATNIKCGNSLIGHDFFETVVIPSAREESIKIIAAKRPQKRLAPAPVAGGSHKTTIPNDLYQKINPFDWHTEFPKIFSGKNPGFDAIIGNPPYVRVHNIDYEIIDYLKLHFESAYKRIDISVCFMELAKNLLSSHGYTGVITSVQFFTTEYGERIREILANNKLECIVDFSGARVFQKATTYPGIIIFSKGSPSHFQVFTDIQIEPSGSLEQMLSFAQTHSVKCSSIRKGTWNFTNLKYESILKKLKSNTIPLEKIGKSHTGLFTGLNDVLLLTKEQINSLSLEKTIVRPIIMGKDPIRYGKPTPSRYVIYPYKDKQNRTKIVEESELKRHYPTCYKYLISKKPKLEKRMDSRKKICETRPWYSLTRFSTIEVIESPKILTPGEVRRNKFCLDLNKSAFYCARVFAITSKQLNLKFLLGILNSKVINIWLHTNCSLKQGGYYSYSANVLKKIPIPLIIFSNSKDKAHHDKMIKLVERMLDLHNKLASAKIPDDKTRIQRRIATTDQQIDNLVYELYGLTKEEIKIIEKGC